MTGNRSGKIIKKLKTNEVTKQLVVASTQHLMIVQRKSSYSPTDKQSPMLNKSGKKTCVYSSPSHLVCNYKCYSEKLKREEYQQVKANVRVSKNENDILEQDMRRENIRVFNFAGDNNMLS